MKRSEIQTKILLIKQALILLDEAEKIPWDETDTPNTDRVVLGQRLWWLVKRATQMLEPIKEDLRASGCARIDTADGSHCLILPSPTSVDIPKEHIETIRNALGQRFSLYFDQVTEARLKKDFLTLLSDTSEEDRDILYQHLTLTPRLARVIFKD